MAINSTDIVFRLSTKTGSAGDSTAQNDPNASLGKYVSTTALNLASPLNNLFADVSGADAQAGRVDYRCIFVLNNHGSLTLKNPVVWIKDEVAGGANIAISVDTTAASPKNSSQAQAKEIATETTAPSGQSFSSPTSKEAGLALGDIPPGYVKAIWIRRTVPAGTAAKAADGVTLRVEGDSDP